MRPLNPQEKRTIRVAGIVLGLGLVLLGGQKVWQWIGGQRATYRQQIKEIQAIRDEIKPYAAKVEVVTNLMNRFKMDPGKLSKATLVANASAAMQQAATTGGIQLGPIKESPAKTSSKELTTMQVEGMGQVTSIVTFLYRLESLGYPLIVDSVQLTPQPQPGMVKVSLTITILDFEQWKKEETPNA